MEPACPTFRSRPESFYPPVLRFRSAPGGPDDGPPGAKTAIFAPSLQLFGPPGALPAFPPSVSHTRDAAGGRSAGDVPKFCRLPAKSAIFAGDVPHFGTSPALSPLNYCSRSTAGGAMRQRKPEIGGPEGRQKGDAERRAGESFPPSPGGAGGSGALAPQMKKPPGEGGLSFGVRCGARTHDTQNHNLVLYQLN